MRMIHQGVSMNSRTDLPSRFKANLEILLLAILLFALPAMGETPSAAFDSANKLYEQGKFSDAATAYQKLIETGQVSEALYFNWGNALFKSGKIGSAIAAYQQAERLAPRDADIRANLQFARNQVQGPTMVPDKIARWLGRLSLNEWTWASAAGLWACLLLLTGIQLRPALTSALKPYAVWSGIVTAILCLMFATDFYMSRLMDKAVVIIPEATVRQAPLEESQSAFTLHDGAEVLVLDQKDQWLQVQLDSRRTGWLRKDAVN